MRKKLFAVIMSAMMLVTFMPAMAFAGFASDANTGFALDGAVVRVVDIPSSVAADDTLNCAILNGSYDGVANTVTFALKEADAAILGASALGWEIKD